MKHNPNYGKCSLEILISNTFNSNIKHIMNFWVPLRYYMLQSYDYIDRNMIVMIYDAK